jgi:hypothetical protein
MAAVTTKSDTPASPAYAAPALAHRAGRVLLLLLILVLGLAVGTVGSFLHRAAFSTGSLSWPDGLLLSLGGLVGLLLGLGELLPALPAAHSLVPGRLPGLGCAAAGWVIAVIWLTYVGPPFSFQSKGDVILANDWRSMSFLIVGMALATYFLYRAWIAALDVKLASARGRN